MKRMTQALAITLALLPAAQVLAEATAIEVRKTNGCGCCLSWMNHLEENGFAPTGENMFGGSQSCTFSFPIVDQISQNTHQRKY